MVGANFAIIQVKCGRHPVAFQCEQGQVPSDVAGEWIAGLPLRPCILDEGNAGAWLMRHFLHMGDRMDGPRVGRVKCQRPAASAIGLGKRPGFLQPERVAAQHVAVTRHINRPSRQHRCGRCQHARRVAAGETQPGGKLDQQRHNRAFGQARIQHIGSLGQADFHAGAQGLDQRDFILGFRTCGLRSGQAVCRHDLGFLAGGGQQGQSAQRVRRRQVGFFCQRIIQRRQHVGAIGQQPSGGTGKMVQGSGIAARVRQTKTVSGREIHVGHRDQSVFCFVGPCLASPSSATPSSANPCLASPCLASPCLASIATTRSSASGGVGNRMRLSRSLVRRIRPRNARQLRHNARCKRIASHVVGGSAAST